MHVLAREVERAGEEELRLTLRLEPLAHHLADHALRIPDPLVAPMLLAMCRREAAEVARDQRLELLRREVPDEHEGEVARVGEAVAVERKRFVEAHLVEQLARQRARAEVVL